MSFFYVAAGGAVGAMARYAISLIPARTGFPVLTLVTNLLGAVLIGFVVGLAAEREEISENAVLFWKTGVCGGFTTFSTFSLEAYNLFRGRAAFEGCLYVVLSVTLCLLGVFCGRKLALLLH